MSSKALKALTNATVTLHRVNLVDKDVDPSKSIEKYFFCASASIGDIMEIDIPGGNVTYIDPAFLSSFRLELKSAITKLKPSSYYSDLKDLKKTFSNYSGLIPHEMKIGQTITTEEVSNSYRDDWPPEWQVDSISSNQIDQKRVQLADYLKSIVQEALLNMIDSILSSKNLVDIEDRVMLGYPDTNEGTKPRIIKLKKIKRDHREEFFKNLHDFLIRGNYVAATLPQIKALFNSDSTLTEPIDWLDTQEKLAILISRISDSKSAPFVAACERFTCDGEPLEASKLRGNNRHTKPANLEFVKSLENLLKGYM